MKRRFEQNDNILQAITQAKTMDFDISAMKPLLELGRIKLPTESEMSTARNYIRSNLKKMDENETVLECLYPVRDGYEDVFKLFCAIETFPCSTAISESSFSSLGRIGILGRVHMTNERLRNLTMLAFGSEHLKAIRKNSA